MQQALSDTIDFTAQLDWVTTNMPRVKRAIDLLPDLTGTKITCCMHLEIKMVPGLEGLVKRGAQLFLTTCNTHTVKDDAVNYLSKIAEVQASHGMDHDSWQKSLTNALAWSPTLLCEMGADLTRVLHEQNSRESTVRAAVEATSSGISVLERLELKYPVINWNNVPIKEHLHNRRMVGICTWNTLFERTRLTLHEKKVIVIGYGAVGQSVADSALAFGGNVSIVEADHGRALQATYAGWNVLPLETALQEGDVIVTATGARNVIRSQHFQLLKPGAFLLNVGHRSDEIDTTSLRSYPHRSLIPFVEEFDLGGRIVYLFAGGSMANLTAGFGDSINAFDLTLAIMVAAIGHAVQSSGSYKPGVHALPQEVWESII